MFLKKMRFFITGMSVLCVALSLAGCSGREVAIPTESNTEQAEEGISEVSALEDANVEATAGESGLDSERSNFFSEMPDTFAFSSGAGAWATYVEISEDGSFTGQYHDSDMGDIGEGYPNGTVYICNFYGRSSEPEPTDSQYIYSMKLLDLQIENEEKVGASEIVDGILYVYTTPYGFEDADEFLIYMPGSPLSEMTEECLSWIFLSDSIFAEVPDCYYVIYNVGGQEAFAGLKEGSIWGREFKYENEKAYVNFRPSYYMGSYLSFFPDDDSPSFLSLRVPWDGKSTEQLECEKSWDDDGTRYKVSIVLDKESTEEVLKYVITVECITDPLLDFSPWGSSEPGKIRVVVTEEKAEWQGLLKLKL